MRGASALRGDPSEVHYRTGLSPRTRGSSVSGRGHLPRRRSIPAHAGEPSLSVSSYRPGGVYPRARGGAKMVTQKAPGPDGLSPRTRGSPSDCSGRIFAAGSIPAHAGEPSWPPSRRGRPRVYPRARGGAACWLVFYVVKEGLSPRTRGSRTHHIRRRLQRRSIPAHAGSRSNHRGGRPSIGSIPAHAGEPPSRVHVIDHGGVYPRARGGAGWVIERFRKGAGLSPRTRGSPAGDPTRPTNRRSIPAHAGEPATL